MNRQADLDAVFTYFNEIGIIAQLSGALLQSVLPDGVHQSHFAIVNHLSRMGDGREPARIAAAMQVTKATMTHSLKVLEGHGFIAIEPNPKDARGKLVFLTDKGRAFRDEAMRRVVEKFTPLVTGDIAETMARALPDLVVMRKHLDDNR